MDMLYYILTMGTSFTPHERPHDLNERFFKFFAEMIYPPTDTPGYWIRQIVFVFQ
jgi:hypothetical protein